MTVLIISPDYVSHYNPLSVLARAAASVGRDVVVATGPGLRDRVESQGYRWCELRLGPAANTGVADDDPAIRAFLDATAAGPLATIAYQAEQRERDLLWQPERIIGEIATLVDRVDPDQIVVDHVSFSSTLGAYATGRPFVTVVPGHPSQLPVGAERYGIPATWPSTMEPHERILAKVQWLADRVTEAFTERWNQALATSGSARPPVDDAFRVHGDRVLYNSVVELAEPERLAAMPEAGRFVGPLVRQADWEARREARWESWRDGADARPRVYVGFGTFLSHRGDVLARVAEGLRLAGVRASIATGPTPIESLGPIPDHWLVAPTLPQVELLASADLVVHHGGNNSVQESLAAGCRQIVMPFSTDQFANAADLERVNAATVLAPNSASAQEIAATVEASLSDGPGLQLDPLSTIDLANELLTLNQPRRPTAAPC